MLAPENITSHIINCNNSSIFASDRHGQGLDDLWPEYLPGIAQQHFLGIGSDAGACFLGGTESATSVSGNHGIDAHILPEGV